MAKNPRSTARDRERARRQGQGVTAKIVLTVERLSPKTRGGKPDAALVRLEGDGFELAEVRYPQDDSAASAESVVSSLRPWLERALRKGLEKAFGTHD